MSDRAVDLVIVERNWISRLGYPGLRELFCTLTGRNIPFLYATDDDLLRKPVDFFDVDGSLAMHAKPLIRWLAREAVGILVSTNPLANALAGLNRNIAVVPNALDERLFAARRSRPTALPTGQPLVFGYMGTFTHLDDLLPVAQAIRRILHTANGKLVFEIVGVGDQQLLKRMFHELPVVFRIVPKEAVPYEAFVDWMQTNLHWDFAIAPLVDTRFNRSKSDIKYLDYAALGIPGLFSAVTPYEATVRHRDNGLLVGNSAHEWESALRTMTNDAPLRERIAGIAHDEVWSQRMLEQRATDWLLAIRMLLSAPPRIPVPPPETPPPPDTPAFVPDLKTRSPRDQKLLRGLNLAGRGLEVGPSYSPVAPKSAGFRVDVVDHASAESLRTKYVGLGMDVSKIEEVDYIWSGEPLGKLTGKHAAYDWIIASHVIEHTPDLVSFLNECEAMLVPGGILALAIPDHRYCFDHLRPVSTPGDIIQAYVERRTIHTPGTVWDHFSSTTTMHGRVSWEVGTNGPLQPMHSIEQAKESFAKAVGSGDYLDVHNWRFTPDSFQLAMHDIRLLGYSKLAVVALHPTVGCEFIVQFTSGESSPHGSEDRLALLQAVSRKTGK